MSSLNNIYWLISRTTNCRLYSNISQILQLYKVWGHYNRFDSMKSLGVYYWYVKMPRCGCVEHGLQYITFYAQQHIAHLAACTGPLLVRKEPLGAPAFVKLAYSFEGLGTCGFHIQLSDSQTNSIWLYEKIPNIEAPAMPGHMHHSVIMETFKLKYIFNFFGSLWRFGFNC